LPAKHDWSSPSLLARHDITISNSRFVIARGHSGGLFEVPSFWHDRCTQNGRARAIRRPPFDSFRGTPPLEIGQHGDKNPHRL
jgi:hypothetical protein